MDKSIDLILGPKQEELISLNELKKKYKFADDSKKIIEQCYENSAEMLKANNSRNFDLTLFNTSRIDKGFKDSSMENNNLIGKNFNNKMNEQNKSISNSISINNNNNSNYFMINADKDIDKYASFDSKVLKSILKIKPNNPQDTPLNLNKSIAKAAKRVLIEDQILPTCLKTKSLSILSSSDLNLHVLNSKF